MILSFKEESEDAFQEERERGSRTSIDVILMRNLEMIPAQR